MPLYFAYGSNMDQAAMLAALPGLEAGRHRAADAPPLHHLREGYASVVRDPQRRGLGHGVGSGALRRAGARPLREPLDGPLHQGHPAGRDGAGAAPGDRLCGRSAKPARRFPATWKAWSRRPQHAGLPADYIAEPRHLAAEDPSTRLRPRRGPKVRPSGRSLGHDPKAALRPASAQA